MEREVGSFHGVSMSMERNPPCPQCGGHATREGSLKILKQEALKYRCSKCGKYFSTFTNTLFHYLNYDARTVSIALELANQYHLPLRSAERLLHKRFNLIVPRSTLADWNKRLGGKPLELVKPSFSKVWHVDEVFVRHEQRSPEGKRKWFDYLWVVSDDHSNVIAMHLTKDRSTKSAVKALEKAKQAAGFSPEVLVSDDYTVYPHACRIVFGKQTMHVTAHFAFTSFFYDNKFWSFSNNIAERLNSTIRHWLRGLRGYANLAAGQRFFQRMTLVLNLCRSVDLADALVR